MTLARCQNYRVHHMIIDEAQDLHPDFFALLYRIVDNTTIFADMNQQLRNDQNSVLDDIRDCLNNFEERILTRNYRNTKEIAAVAERFYVGMATGKCVTPRRSGPMPRVTPCLNLNAAVERIARYARTHGDQSIGVVVTGVAVRRQYFNRLQARLGNRVQTYASKMDAPGLDFTGNRITVICLESVKGLEFDAVFLNMSYQVGPLNEVQKMGLYVATSRSREYLEFVHEGDSPAWILANLDGVVHFAVSGSEDEELF